MKALRTPIVRRPYGTAPFPPLPFTALLLTLLSAFTLQAQGISPAGLSGDPQGSSGNPQRIDVVQADFLEGYRSAEGAVRRLIGQVVLRQENTTLSCDSALYFAESNLARTYGNVRIVQADTIQARCDSLYFLGDERKVLLMSNVVLSDRSAVLRTSELDYNLDTRIGRYRSGGQLDNQGSVLSSTNGWYSSRAETSFFRDSVVLVHPQYTLYADTLEYRVDIDLALFHGSTTIVHEQNTIYCEGGSYDGQRELGIFTRNTRLDSPPRRILADSLVYERRIGLGRAWGNVLFTDSVKQLSQRSPYGEYDEPSGVMNSSGGRTLLSHVLQGDTLYIGADFVRSRSDSLERREFDAFGRVRLFKSDLQGICDSMTWRDADSTITLFTDPVLWSASNQFSADTIALLFSSGEMRKIFLRQRAFIASEPDSLVYNQIKGRLVEGFFSEGELVRLDVIGNGQSIYYAEDAVTGYLGANQAACSHMVIRLLDEQVDRIAFLEKTDATFRDLKLSDFRSLKLEGFAWRNSERPASAYDLMLPPPEPIPQDAELPPSEPGPTQPSTGADG